MDIALAVALRPKIVLIVELGWKVQCVIGNYRNLEVAEWCVYLRQGFLGLWITPRK